MQRKPVVLGESTGRPGDLRLLRRFVMGVPQPSWLTRMDQTRQPSVLAGGRVQESNADNADNAEGTPDGFCKTVLRVVVRIARSCAEESGTAISIQAAWLYGDGASPSMDTVCSSGRHQGGASRPGGRRQADGKASYRC